MRSRIFIIVLMIMFCIMYVEARVRRETKLYEEKFLLSRCQNKHIKHLQKTFKEKQNAVVNDFYYEGNWSPERKKK